jgi:type IV pilus assembly protein PilM
VARFQIQNPMGIAAGGRPAAACEITPQGVVAGATPAAGQAPVYAAESLPGFTVMPGLLESNLLDPPSVTAAIRTALGQVQPRVRSVTVVVPDAAVRVFVLDFDTLPSRQEEALPVLRFRLRKSVPFDVEHAGISYQVLSEGSSRLETQWKVLAAIMPGPVLAEYEGVVRAAGYEPGVVLPASLAALCALSAMDSQEAVLAVNLNARSLTTSIVAGNDILLYRTVELPLDAEALRAEVQRSIAVSAAFFEDKLQVRPHRLLYSGMLSAQDFAGLLGDAEFAVGEVVQQPQVGMASAMGQYSVAGVTGALAGTN